MPSWSINTIPSFQALESRKILKLLPAAHAALAELKGVAASIPNQAILINTLGLQEAKDSSAIENIITTHDELFKSELALDRLPSSDAKEVQNYIGALKRGFDLISRRGLLTSSMIIEIQGVLEKNNAGFRKLPGTALKNVLTNEVVYTPPQDFDTISNLMAELEKMINDPTYSDYHPIVKMAIIHFQFESIHPFYDGNGRTGRIINVLYLILSGLLDLPILYLSSYIIKNKSDYYRLLQQVRDEEAWEAWIVYMINAARVTAEETVNLIKIIKLQMMDMKQLLRTNYKFYSHDLLNHLFQHPYTKIEFLESELGISRVTAANYLNTLANDGVLRKEKFGRTNFYINEDLFQLFGNR
ncbi:Fic family protein [Neolewinella agarilytica]|uniref:Fic family protein n=1 Tax=Neolewinella agarilytica TaxID=478744 RepID=UPI00399D2338